MASIDSARQQLALHGSDLLESALSLARYVRQEINAIPGLSSFGRDIVDGVVVTGFDETKITIDFSGVGLDGIEAEKCLRREGIEVELVAGNHVLALITLGDTKETAQSLVDACRAIASGKTLCAAAPGDEPPLPVPQVAAAPRKVWNGPVEQIPFDEAGGRVAAETVTFYPPGIPALAAGEIITEACQQYIHHKMGQGYKPNGPADGTLQTIRVQKEDSHEG